MWDAIGRVCRLFWEICSQRPEIMDVLSHSAPAGSAESEFFFGKLGQKYEWILVDIRPSRAV